MRSDLWNDENTAQLVKLWDTAHSASQIGVMLGANKNQIIGKANRMKLPARPSPVNMSTPETRARTAARVAKRKVVPNGITLATVTGCVWPFGDVGDDAFHFCNAKQIPGKPYCSEHHKDAYLKPKKKKREPLDRFYIPGV